MQSKDLLTMAAAALGVFMFYGYLDKQKGGTGAAAQAYTKLIGSWGGWQYFSDGTAIGPDGAYYYKGQQITQGSQPGFVGAANLSNNGGAGVWSA